MRAKIFFLLKIVATVGLVAYLFTKIDARRVYAALLLADWRFVALSFVSSVTAWYFSAWRWRTLLDPQGSELSVSKLLTFNLIGNFYGMVLPGGKLSGDAMGAYRLSGSVQNIATEKIFTSLVADRLFGFLTIIFFDGLLLFFGFGAAIFDGGLARYVGMAMFMFPPIVIGTLFLLDRLPPNGSPGFIGRMLAARREYFTYSRNLLFVVVLSCVAVGLSGLSLILLGIALGIPLAYGDLAAVYFLATILIAIPITIGGIGLREGGLAYFLVRMGAETYAASALAVLMFAVFAALTLIGGTIEFILRLKKDKLN